MTQPASLTAAAASLADVQAALASVVDPAHALYALLADVQQKLASARGSLALFMGDDHSTLLAVADPAALTDAEKAAQNAVGFAQNVAHALDGLDRVLGDAAKASLTISATKRDFAANVKSWQDAAGS